MATTQLKLGPTDHGKPLTLTEYEEAEYAHGYRYEIIDGRLYVSPESNFPEFMLNNWLVQKLNLYAGLHPDIINLVAFRSRVFVHDAERPTIPEPDIAAYHDLPLDQDFRDIHWRDLEPILVVEVLVESDEHKDLVRNPDLYFTVPSIREYWVLDGRENPNEPTLIQHRRHGKRWVIRNFAYGATFTTKLLPGFEIVINPRQ